MKAATLVLVCVLVGASMVAGAYVERAATVTGSSTTSSPTSTTTQDAITSYSVCFSPGGNCAQQLIALIGTANSSIHIMIYEFSNTAIAQALVQAKERGVDVKVIMDGSEATTDNVAVLPILNQSGIPLKIYTPLNGILHDKIAIIDGEVVVTGSYNWSYSADDFNDENLLVLRSTSLAAQYEADFQTLWNSTSSLPP